MDAMASNEFSVWVDYGKFANEVFATIACKNAEPLDLLRTHYYHCLPYRSSPPTDEERKRFDGKRSFFDALTRLDRFQVRLGRLVFQGHTDHGKPIYQQKGVDLMLGLDLALLSSKHRITHAALVAGDGDFVPAVEIAKREGIIVHLFHGPLETVSRELWLSADARIELTQDFMNRVAK